MAGLNPTVIGATIEMFQALHLAGDVAADYAFSL
jgi:hypothetical protein